MNPRSQKEIPQVDIERMIQDLEEGVISAEEREILNKLICSDPNVCELYCDHMELATLLRNTADNRAELGTMPVSEGMIKDQRRRSAMVSLSYGIAAVLLLSIGFLFYHVNRPDPTESTGIVMEGSREAKFRVTYFGDEERDVSSLQAGDKVHVEQGLVRFTFPSGVEAIVEGPSEMGLVSEQSVRMKGGFAWFRVPEAGHGFTVITEQLRVVDLGTEFGVSFDNQENVQVHVGKGEVRVEPTLKNLKTANLTANHAMQFDVFGRGKETDCYPSLFRREFTRSMPYVHWSFDENKNGVFDADGTMPGVKGFEARLVDVSNKQAPQDADSISVYQAEGKFGNSLSLKGDSVFADTDFSGLGGGSPRTLAMWVRHRKEKFSGSIVSPYCVWGSRHSASLWKISLKEEKSRYKFYSVSLSAAGDSPFPRESLGEWTHLTTVYTGRILEGGTAEIIHYINGNRMEANRRKGTINTDITSKHAKPLRFGMAITGGSKRKSVDGDLDEVYLFRGVLTEAEVKQLMSNNRLDFFRQ